MNQLVLVDEINRTTPKTQSSLLEAMAENQVTIDGAVHRLPSPFLVIATENPVEYVGTYPLPEAQLDRFMMCLKIGYTDKDNEIRIAKQMLEHRQADNVTAVCTTNDIEAMKADVERITVSDAVISYIVDIIRATREEERFVLGASPRAMLALTKAARAKAYLEERDFVKPDDVKAVARQVLLHRFTLTSKARGQREDVLSIFNNILTKVKVPV